MVLTILIIITGNEYELIKTNYYSHNRKRFIMKQEKIIPLCHQDIYTALQCIHNFIEETLVEKLNNLPIGSLICADKEGHSTHFVKCDDAFWGPRGVNHPKLVIPSHYIAREFQEIFLITQE